MQSFYSTMFVASILAACGGSDLDPGSGDDPGTGTSTLTVEAAITASNRVDNARTAGDFDTELSVRVQKAGVDVTTGSVTVTSASGSVALQFDTANDRNRWRALAAGYDEVYVLDIASGDDALSGVRVDGPDIHVFTAPTAGAEVDASTAVTVTWDRGDQADSAAIRATETDDIALPDAGSYLLPAGSLKAKPDEPEQNELRLRRANRVTPAGAAGGSVMTVTVENRLHVIAAPDPTL